MSLANSYLLSSQTRGRQLCMGVCIHTRNKSIIVSMGLAASSTNSMAPVAGDYKSQGILRGIPRAAGLKWE